MNKVTRRAVAAVITTIVGATALTGCGSDEDSKKNDGIKTIDCTKSVVEIKLNNTGTTKSLTNISLEDIPGDGEKVQYFSYSRGDFTYSGDVHKVNGVVKGGGSMQKVPNRQRQEAVAFTFDHFEVVSVTVPIGC